jgi:hypothetical protein
MDLVTVGDRLLLLVVLLDLVDDDDVALAGADAVGSSEAEVDLMRRFTLGLLLLNDVDAFVVAGVASSGKNPNDPAAASCDDGGMKEEEEEE